MKKCSSAACVTVVYDEPVNLVIVSTTLKPTWKATLTLEEWRQFLRDAKAGKWDDVLPDPQQRGEVHVHVEQREEPVRILPVPVWGPARA